MKAPIFSRIGSFVIITILIVFFDNSASGQSLEPSPNELEASLKRHANTLKIAITPPYAPASAGTSSVNTTQDKSTVPGKSEITVRKSRPSITLEKAQLTYDSVVADYQTATTHYCNKTSQSPNNNEFCARVEALALDCAINYIRLLTGKNWQNQPLNYEEVKRVLTATLHPNLVYFANHPDAAVDAVEAALKALPRDDQRNALVELLVAAQNPAALQNLTEWLKRSNNPQFINLEKSIQSSKMGDVAKIILELRNEEMRQMSSLLSNGRERRFGTGVSSTKLKVTFVGAKNEQERAFRTQLLRYLTMKFPQRLLPIEDYDLEAWTSVEKKLLDTCGGVLPSERYDALLTVRFENNLAKSKLWTVRSTEGSKWECIANASIESEPLPSHDVSRAASDYFLELTRRFSFLSGGLSLASPDIETIGPTLHPTVGLEVQIETPSSEVPKIFLQRVGIKITNFCHQNLETGLTSRLRKSYSTAIGDQDRPNEAAPRLELKKDATGRSCVGTLSSGIPVLRVAVTPQIGEPSDWTIAGDDLARVVGQFYNDVREASLANSLRTFRNDTSNSRFGTPALALISSGLPLALDERSGLKPLGWTLSAIDTMALVGGAAMLWGAVDARNSYANEQHSQDLRRADTLYTAGVIAALVGVAMRVAGVIVYGIVPNNSSHVQAISNQRN